MGVETRTETRADTKAEIATSKENKALSVTDSSSASDVKNAADIRQETLSDGPRPMPRRLSSQERWNRLSIEERKYIIDEWLKLDETVRPVFPVFRDNTLEAQTHQAGAIAAPSNTLATGASSP